MSPLTCGQRTYRLTLRSWWMLLCLIRAFLLFILVSKWLMSSSSHSTSLILPASCLHPTVCSFSLSLSLSFPPRSNVGGDYENERIYKRAECCKCGEARVCCCWSSSSSSSSTSSSSSSFSSSSPTCVQASIAFPNLVVPYGDLLFSVMFPL